jgi:hypothetical protein
MHDMAAVRALVKAAVTHRHDVFAAAQASELEALVRDSR